MILNKINSSLKWYFSNVPLGCFILEVILCWFYYNKVTYNFPDEALCLQPHFVMTGQVSRLVKYAFFHHGIQTCALSILLVGSFGTIAERQLGTIGFIYIVLALTVFTGIIITFLSIIMAFTSQFSSITYNCPGFGTSAPLFAIIVIVFKNILLSRILCVFFSLRKTYVPWLLLVIVQFVFPETKLMGNFCGCVAGTIYTIWFSRCLPSRLIGYLDDRIAPCMSVIPVLKYTRTVSARLPVYVQDVAAREDKTRHQPFPVPEDSPVPIVESSVPNYKVNKLQQMGFQREQAIIALDATTGNMEKATELLYTQQVGINATVLPSQASSSGTG